MRHVTRIDSKVTEFIEKPSYYRWSVMVSMRGRSLELGLEISRLRRAISSGSQCLSTRKVRPGARRVGPMYSFGTAYIGRAFYAVCDETLYGPAPSYETM